MFKPVIDANSGGQTDPIAPRPRDYGRYSKFLIICYALLNGSLYSALLPLWEGFDEPFHYAYVQFISTRHRLPVLGQAQLSKEVQASIQLSPTSHIVQRSLLIPTTTFDRYFSTPHDARLASRRALAALPDGWKHAPAEYLNYEAHQAPLAYAILAIPDWALSNLPITFRILALRLIVVIATTALTFSGTVYLNRQLGLPDPFGLALLFCVFSSQMFWATNAHISNDWLAVSISVWLFAMVAVFIRAPSNRAAFLLGTVVSLGLLAKAYFIPLLAFAATIVASQYLRKHLTALGLFAFILPVLVIAGPWYARNILLYRSLSGTVEAIAGVGLQQVLAGLRMTNLSSSVGYMARGSLWTGNNSFTSFSVLTLDLVLILLAIAITAFCKSCFKDKILRTTEGALIIGIVIYCFALLYITGSSAYFRHGASAGASPWYMQPLLVPVLCIAMLGLSRTGNFGHIVRNTMVVLWGYVMVATYFAKLIPLYGGYSAPRATIAALSKWYIQEKDSRDAILGTTSLVSEPAVIYVLFVCVVLCAMAVSALVLKPHQAPSAGCATAKR